MSEIVEFHTKLQHDAHRWVLIQNGNATLEYRLPNNRVADIISRTKDERIQIIEVKTVLAPYLIEKSIEKYRVFCDELIIAAPAGEISKLLKNGKIIDLHSKVWNCGYLWLTERNAGYFPCGIASPMNQKTRSTITAHLRHLSWGRVKSAQGRP